MMNHDTQVWTKIGEKGGLKELRAYLHRWGGGDRHVGAGTSGLEDECFGAREMVLLVSHLCMD